MGVFRRVNVKGYKFGKAKKDIGRGTFIKASFTHGVVAEFDLSQAYKSTC